MGHYKDLTETGPLARNASGTQGRFLFSGTCVIDSKNIHKQFYKTNYGHYPIQCKRTNLWNAIPEDLNNTKSQYSIKNKSSVTTVLSGVQVYKLKLIYT